MDKKAEALLYKRLREGKRDETLSTCQRNLEGWQREAIVTFVPGEREYPLLLSSIHSPPSPLFARGDTGCLYHPVKVAVVGSRDTDQHGCEIAYTLGRELAVRGVCVVSGLALGIDAAAHEGALASGVYRSTIAVLANGLDGVYPLRHRNLAQRIIEQGGLLLSEYEPGVKPYPSYFLQRNRIIAGLSLCTIVVQAALRSGALSTARSALEEGRDVMAVPGPWGNRRYEGTNALIKQGAYIVTSVEDVMELLPRTERRGDPIINFIRLHREISLEALHANFPEREDLSLVLSELELEGELSHLPGGLIKLRG